MSHSGLVDTTQFIYIVLLFCFNWRSFGGELREASISSMLGLDEDEPNLRDVMKMTGTITSQLANHDARLDDMAP